MPKPDFRDPWMDESRDPAHAGERSLGPAPSRGFVWLLLGLAVVAVAGYLAVQNWPGASALRKPEARQSAPVQPPAMTAPSTREDAQAQPQNGPPPRIQRFAKCMSPTGAVTYSDGPCPAGTKGSEVAVRPDLNLADGMSDEARRASMRHNSAVAQAVVEHERQVAANVDIAVSACASLDALIASIDARARQPLPGFEQDRLKDERRRARDRQFALRCG